MFTVTPIVNRCTGKAIRLCLTAVEAALPKSRFCKRALHEDPGSHPAGLALKPPYSVLRVDRRAGSKVQRRSESPWHEEWNLHSQEPITEFICRVNYI